VSELLRRVEVDGGLADVRITGDIVEEVAPRGLMARSGDTVTDGRNGALLPGLHDHHLHVLALAAARTSVDCGAGLEALRTAHGTGWIRGRNYHEATNGEVDRHVLDRLVRDRPVRVQHRSGALWLLNSEALRRVSAVLDDSPDVERDEHGEPTGRLWRYDARLRPALPAAKLDVVAVGRELAALGITGVTDATPDLDDVALALLARLPQRVVALGASTGAKLPPGLTAGPFKILLPDHDLPSYDNLVATIAANHAAGRAVAVHCVTRESLILVLAALDETGTHPGDRIEHASIVPHETISWLAELKVAVVTQPDFLRTRGATYLREVAADDLPHVYPHARLLAAGVPTVASSDAPYGSVDPWRVIATASNRPIGPEESVTAEQALEGYLTDPLAPGVRARRVRTGSPADLVLLRVPLAEALRAPEAGLVRATWIGGEHTGQ
jgi:predicted amidohydrolase YtcJ